MPCRCIGEWMYRRMFFLTLALAGGEWSASRPSCFTTGKRGPRTNWIGGWVDPRAGLDDTEKRNLTLPGLKLQSLGRPAHSQLLYQLCYPGSYRTDISQLKTNSNLLQIWLKMNNACSKSSRLEYGECKIL
jgi:hypothetical protein